MSGFKVGDKVRLKKDYSWCGFVVGTEMIVSQVADNGYIDIHVMGKYSSKLASIRPEDVQQLSALSPAWEAVNWQLDAPTATSRMKVPGGWLVQSFNLGAGVMNTVFVADPDHLWNIEEGV